MSLTTELVHRVGDDWNEEAAAAHRDELNKYQTDLLTRNTDLTEQIHTLAEQLNQLTEAVHNAICVARATHPATPAIEPS